MLSSGDEIGEAVHLLLALTVLVPAIALVLAATIMGKRVDEAEIDKRQRMRGEAGRNGHAIGAVAVKEERGGAIERRRLAVEERDGNALAVLCRRHDAAGDVEARIVAARNLLRLPQGTLPTLHVVIEHLRRRR